MLSGGGARAAYQVGVLRLLAREFPRVVPGILTGVSAGGINAAYLAACQGPFAAKVENLGEIWSNIRLDDVFRVDLRDLAARSLRWGGRLLGAWSIPLRCACSSNGFSKTAATGFWESPRACRPAGCARLR